MKLQATKSYSPFARMVGKNIRRARLRKQLSAHEAAYHVGMAQPDYVHIESGKYAMMLHTAHRICQVLSIPLDALLGPHAVGGSYWGKKKIPTEASCPTCAEDFIAGRYGEARSCIKHVIPDLEW